MEINSKDVGDETEAMIIHELLAHGYSVSLPFGDNDRYDLIIDDGGDLYRVQYKTAWRTKLGTIRFNTHSQTTRDGEYHESTNEGEIDAFLVRCPDDEALYWVHIERASKRKMALRYTADIDHPRSTGRPISSSKVRSRGNIRWLTVGVTDSGASGPEVVPRARVAG